MRRGWLRTDPGQQGHGRFEMVQGNLERAVELMEESLTVYRELADDEGTARVLTFLGFAANLQGDYRWQRSLLEEALPLSRRLGDHRNVSLTLNFLALLASDQGDQERAAALWEEDLALARKMGDTWSILRLAILKDLSLVKDLQRLMSEEQLL